MMQVALHREALREPRLWNDVLAVVSERRFEPAHDRGDVLRGQCSAVGQHPKRSAPRTVDVGVGADQGFGPSVAQSRCSGSPHSAEIDLGVELNGRRVVQLRVVRLARQNRQCVVEGGRLKAVVDVAIVLLPVDRVRSLVVGPLRR